MHYLINAHVLHLIDVGVPHLGEEPEGRWGIGIIYRELNSSLRNNKRHAKYKYRHEGCIHNMMSFSTFK